MENPSRSKELHRIVVLLVEDVSRDNPRGEEGAAVGVRPSGGGWEGDAGATMFFPVQLRIGLL